MTTQPLTLILPVQPDSTLPLALWLRRARTRATLRDLDARGLKDIGLTPEARQHECVKWFWSA